MGTRQGAGAVQHDGRAGNRLSRLALPHRPPTLWTPGLTSAGQGIKIAIIDEGIDQTHPFFSPAGYTMPQGFPSNASAYNGTMACIWEILDREGGATPNPNFVLP